MLSFLASLLGTHILLIVGLVALVALVLFGIAVYNHYKNNPAQVVVDAVTGATTQTSLFSGILSSVGSVFGGLFSSVEQYLLIGGVVLFLTVTGSFYLYYNWSQAKIQAVVQDEQKLSDALQTQTNAYLKLQQDTKNLLKSYKDLQAKENAIQKQNDLLNKKIQQYDFQNNAIKNHDQTEKDINDQTAKMLQDLQNLTDPNSSSVLLPGAAPARPPHTKMNPPKASSN